VGRSQSGLRAATSWSCPARLCYCKPDFGDLYQISYPIAKRGYANVTRFHGTSILNANRFAFMATTFKDQPSAHEAFAAISSMDMEIRYEESIVNNSRD
jgi:hypothetical protein